MWSADMYSYSGLHYLRRIAAHSRHKEAGFPRKAIRTYRRILFFNSIMTRLIIHGRVFGKLFGGTAKKRTFDHLIIHSDAEGYYIPEDFSSVLIPGQSFLVAGGMVGSSQRPTCGVPATRNALALPLTFYPGKRRSLDRRLGRKARATPNGSDMGLNPLLACAAVCGASVDSDRRAIVFT